MMLYKYEADALVSAYYLITRTSGILNKDDN